VGLYLADRSTEPSMRLDVPHPRTDAGCEDLGTVTGAPLVADDHAIRHEWKALLAAATSPEERDEVNDVFGRTVR